LILADRRVTAFAPSLTHVEVRSLPTLVGALRSTSLNRRPGRRLTLNRRPGA
jgi:hypothetical protein